MSEPEYDLDDRVEMLKRRTKRCMCKFCGGRLRLRRIVFSDYEDARTEIFCPECDRIEFGVEPEIYHSAKFFVEETGFNYFQELDDSKRTQEMNIAKVCDILEWGNKHLGFLSKDGFVVPVEKNNNFWGQCITLTAKDLD